MHAVTLLGDSYLKPSVWDITIPFVSGYEEPWMSIGIVAVVPALVLLVVRHLPSNPVPSRT